MQRERARGRCTSTRTLASSRAPLRRTLMCQHPRPAFSDQALDAAGVLMGADGANHRQPQMPTVGLDAHRPGGETDPVS
ncbi:hypothetical protein BST45_05570 [Mycobacterium shinjukuense]|nr:hypothetical protein BST45_05570 [Mycobacterium shinjukuense]